MRPLHRYAAAQGFLSRLPSLGLVLEEDDGPRSLPWFPVVGLVLGLLAAIPLGLAGPLGPTLAAALSVGVLALLSGGLHLDGLASTCDGLGRGADRENTLEIMQDPRVGAHGAAALVLLLVVHVAALAEASTEVGLWAAVAAAAVGRWLALPAIVHFDYARSEGLGTGFKAHASPTHVLQGAAVAGAAASLCGLTGLIALGAALLVTMLFAARVSSRLGGLTGDAYGAVVELGQVTFLIVLALG